MTTYRIDKHPILPISTREKVTFFWNGQALTANRGEMIASALFANGIRTFGHHPRDGSPQGIFCANGQCSQCLVIANGVPVKSCMTEVLPGMRVEPIDELPRLPEVTSIPAMHEIETIKVTVLILGGGPAGMSAAGELGRDGVDVLLIDDKDRLGGKLVLQTHRFFGSVEAVHAGTRGINIASLLSGEIEALPSVKIWTNSTALAVFSDKKIGVLRGGDEYVLIEPQVLLVATGAREKSLAFKGNTLPGVYGAGAFQTLVNRDRVRAAERLFIVGGGNVGLIAGYHALQAGIEVVGLVEALPECGGYKVHKDKLARLGVPIYTSHTVVSANGDDQVESVTIAQIDDKFQPVPGTEKSFACDTLLIAVGLDPVNEFTAKAREYGMNVFDAGDAEEIAEASTAIFSGRIKGRMIARDLGVTEEEIPNNWSRTAQILKSKPGRAGEENIPTWEEGVFPILHCVQEIPCNPCSAVCPKGLIKIDKSDIRVRPRFIDDPHQCLGCEQCVAICPGLAITLVDYRQNKEMPTVTIAYEFSPESLKVGGEITVTDSVGEVLGDVVVEDLRAIERNDHTVLVRVRAPKEYAKHVAGIRVQDPSISKPLPEVEERLEDDVIVCRCERVTAGEVRKLIRSGCRDMNEIKAVTRAGMGACGGKTCTPLIKRLFREEGVPLSEVEENVKRPLFVEVPLGVFAGAGSPGVDPTEQEEAGHE
ncbi:MAG TPA: 4Fe-4S dicluster domain-containing protein [Candidatus Acetothermia bacterium]|nr:4Fe-4S dicluster domain-containing protein [Candidatus Acetothermia bacterium]